MSTRRQRGNDTTNAVAAYLRNNGWPYAEPVGTGRAGTDIRGTPALSWEIKARRQLSLIADMKQAAAHIPGAIPILLIRPDGMGPATIRQWPFIIPLHTGVELLHQAGYGTPQDPHDLVQS